MPGLLCTQHSNLIALVGSSRGLLFSFKKRHSWSMNHTPNIDDTGECRRLADMKASSL